MAVRDFFKNIFRKQKQLPEATIPEEKKPEARNKLNVYADQEGRETRRTIKININGTLIPVAEITGVADGVSLKEMNRAITRVLDSVQVKTEIERSLSYKKQLAREELDSLGRHYGFVILPEIDKILDSYLPKQKVDYKKINQTIPKVADISRMSESQVLDFGKVLEDRLAALGAIKTPEDVQKNKDDIVSFMQSQETDDPLGMIIAANIENINAGNDEKLDLPTILACAKSLTTFNNEDTIMYSAYLKLEEKRILKRIQTEIEGTRTEENSEIIDGLLADIEAMKIGTGSTKEEKESSIVQYMMAIRMERDIERYVKNIAQKDMQVRKYVLDNRTPNAIQISTYFSSRIASLGQVTPIRGVKEADKVVSLRQAIEESEFKDPDDHETSEFLFQVARVERDYILNNYSALLERYHTMVGQRSEDSPALEEI